MRRDGVGWEEVGGAPTGDHSFPGLHTYFGLPCGLLTEPKETGRSARLGMAVLLGPAVSTFYPSASGPAVPVTARLPSLPGFKRKEEQRDWSSLPCLLCFFSKPRPRPFLPPCWLPPTAAWSMLGLTLSSALGISSVCLGPGHSPFV